MQIFIIKGLLKGMVKLDNKLHFVGNGFDDVAEVLLYDGKNFKIIEKNNFKDEIKNFVPNSIILLDNKFSVLGAGCTQGKIDVDKLIFEYNSINLKRFTPVNMLDNNDVKEKKNIENPSKIDIILQNVPNEQSNLDETDSFNNEFESENIEENENCQQFKDNGVKTDSEYICLKDDDLEEGIIFIKENMEDIPLQSNNFYREIKDNLENFLSAYPKNEELENKVWGSKWVKIIADYNYSVGVIFEDNEPSIIAYALPYDNYHEIDMENKGFGEWLQMDGGKGYLIYYQDAKTGKMITA